MWENVLECISQRETAICIPIPGGQPFPIYWYGVLAALGIFVGAFYAAKHVEGEGGDPETVWDALLWIMIPALIGARLWYVVQLALAGSTQYSLSRPLEIINPRLGGMNIFGGVVFAVIAAVIYVRVRKLDFWPIADGGLMGLFLGHAIGRFGNWINQELYGPPIEVPWLQWLGVRIPQGHRIPPWTDMTTFPYETTRFHPTFFYEAFWLFLCFGILYYLYRRYQERMIPGTLAGGYLILSGIGRFVIEAWRPDQPLLPGTSFSFSRVLALFYIVIGLIIVLDRLGYMKIPFIKRPVTRKQRERELQEIRAERRRAARRAERERDRKKRAKEQEQRTGEEGEVTEEEIPLEEER
jgi:phosphatidylglycerol:prolipoprotein diacylglycerol transferase